MNVTKAPSGAGFCVLVTITVVGVTPLMTWDSGALVDTWLSASPL